MLESFYDGQTSLFVNMKRNQDKDYKSCLPIPGQAEQKGKDTEVVEEDKGGTKQMNVMIVIDNARKGLIAIMDWEKYGFKVAGDVQNGRKALEFLRTHPVDIVFTDIDMPEIDGLELMQMCKEEFPDIKFVIFSVYENFSYAQTAIRMGALDYISKISFSPEE